MQPSAHFDHITIEWNVSHWPEEWQQAFTKRWLARVSDHQLRCKPLGDYRLTFQAIIDQAAAVGDSLKCDYLEFEERVNQQNSG